MLLTAGCSGDGAGTADDAERSPTTTISAPSATPSTTSSAPTTSTSEPGVTDPPVADPGAPEATAATGGGAPTTVAPDVVSTPPAEPGGGDAIPDGTSFGFVQGVGVANPTLTIDIAQLLTGDAAVLAAIEDGAIPATETSVDNDYYIRNQNPKLRTAAIATGAPIMMLVSIGSPDSVPANLTVLSRRFADQPGFPVQVSASGGRITRIDELFFP